MNHGQDPWRTEEYREMTSGHVVSRAQYRGWEITLMPTPDGHGWLAKSLITKPSSNGVGLEKLSALRCDGVFGDVGVAKERALSFAKERIDSKERWESEENGTLTMVECEGHQIIPASYECVDMIGHWFPLAIVERPENRDRVRVVLCLTRGIDKSTADESAVAEAKRRIASGTLDVASDY